MVVSHLTHVFPNNPSRSTHGLSINVRPVEHASALAEKDAAAQRERDEATATTSALSDKVKAAEAALAEAVAQHAKQAADASTEVETAKEALRKAEARVTETSASLSEATAQMAALNKKLEEASSRT